MKREQERLERQRDKLMEAHYAGAIPVDLLGREQERISSSLAKITRRRSALVDRFDLVEKNLKQALDLTVDCATAYSQAPESIKRMFNQVFFERVLVVPDEDVESGVRVSAELREPFDVILGSDLKVVEAEVREMGAKRTASPKVDGPGLAEWVSFQVKGLSTTLLVEVRGFEPLTS
jgi:site-specific DNA recombinase